ncbi:diguanylate cyclase (GGDEF)-like protein/PAS domain S-box-containing protein [Duganella sp. 1224]|uniref:sensor domain-containing protein n=1 Tax=Duganella sp. 1224 TaxID=2587052 RepID=UPI0015CABF63|nr:EAL domain-containing protein [Duganella sp. 1224]NYE62386.1 diguanylate cyclase (GGDEF)-like protein/PAS domain S-box-containing protein [Duganella sp. 1224]
MDRHPQPASTRAPRRHRTQRGGAASKQQADAFDQLFGASRYFAFAIGEDGRLLAWNQHSDDVLGPLSRRTPANTLYATWALPMLQNEALPIARMRGVWRGEIELLGRDGGGHPVTQSIEWRADAAPPCFLCLAHPLADYDVYESRLRFKYLFESHPLAMWVYDLETLRFMVVNAAAVVQYGYTEAEFLQMTIRDIRPAAELERLDRNLAATPARGSEQSGIWTHARRDGTLLQVAISSHSVTLSGRPGRLVFAHDLTERLTLEAALHASRELKQLVINHIPHQIFWKDRDGAYLGCNSVFARFAGLHSNADVAGKRDEDFPWAHNADAIRADERAIMASGRGRLNEEDHMTLADGTVHWYLINKLPFRDQQGQIIGVLGTIEDITERKQAELTLQLRGRALEASVNAIVITVHDDGSDRIEYANPAFARLFGHAPDAVLGHDLESLLGVQAHDQQQALHAAMQSRQEVTLLLRTRHRDSTALWTQLHVGPVRGADGAISHHVCVLTDMTAILEYQEQLEHQANHDALTGLPNRALLNDRMMQGVTFSQRFGHSLWLVFIDLDNFKLINDHLGHQAGDELLCVIANRLRACASEGDTVARLGGDEFLLLLPVANQRPMSSLLQLLQDAIGAPVTLNGQTLAVTCSIGVSVYPADGSEPEQLLKHADIAMYRAKEAGRNQVQFYEAAMHARIAERASIETELRHALARDELRLVYQPKLDLRSGAVTGMEALLRWQHPVLGAVSPARFIGVAEETGMIVAIGRWVLRMACTQAVAWQQAGLPPLRVAVNLSARQFRDQGLHDEVRSALADSGLDPQYLELELTESLMMHNVDDAVAVITELKQLGIALSIDDFGTGYSSLSYLTQFPVDCLKIDQSFTREMLDQPKVAAIVRSVIALGHSLGFRVIAEGVETAAQLDYLRTQGCDEIQGYYFSRPLAPDAVAELLRTR